MIDEECLREINDGLFGLWDSLDRLRGRHSAVAAAIFTGTGK